MAWLSGADSALVCDGVSCGWPLDVMESAD